MIRRPAFWAALGIAGLAACGGPKDVKPAEPPRPADAVPAPPIVLEQFGYRPDDPKIVRIRQPVTGFDTAWASQPRMTYYVRDARTEAPVRTFTLDADPEAPVDALSGDHVWALDISKVTAPGEYVVTSGDGAQVSAAFRVDAGVYKPLLREAFRTFYYQRAGFAKSAPQAGAAGPTRRAIWGPDRTARRGSFRRRTMRARRGTCAAAGMIPETIIRIRTGRRTSAGRC